MLTASVVRPGEPVGPQIAKIRPRPTSAEVSRPVGPTSPNAGRSLVVPAPFADAGSTRPSTAAETASTISALLPSALTTRGTPS
jgi:hypothetical protein